MNKEILNTISEGLLNIGAIKLSPNKPFTYASGIISPVYTDLRKTIGEPKLRKIIANGLAEIIKENFENVQVIAGVATAGIPHAAWVTDILNLPMIYVRSKPKDHGTGQQIEGELKENSNIVMIDDLISTGGSVISAAKAVKNAHSNVLGVISIFSYGLSDADKNFTDNDLILKPLLTYREMIQHLYDIKKISDNEKSLAEKWHQDPWHWKG